MKKLRNQTIKAIEEINKLQSSLFYQSMPKHKRANVIKAKEKLETFLIIINTEYLNKKIKQQ